MTIKRITGCCLLLLAIILTNWQVAYADERTINDVNGLFQEAYIIVRNIGLSACAIGVAACGIVMAQGSDPAAEKALTAAKYILMAAAGIVLVPAAIRFGIRCFGSLRWDPHRIS